MRAVKASADRAAVLEHVARPKPGPGMALVKTLRSGICGSDLNYIRGLQRGRSDKTNFLGHEVCGIVTELGDGVEEPGVGERVSVEPLFRCGQCRNCLAGAYNICERREFVLGNYPDRPGGLSDYFQVPAYCLRPLAKELSDKEGALVEPLAVGVHAIKVARSGFRPAVGVIGAGTIGLAAVAAAAAAGASAITVIARHAHQRQAAMRLGATKVIEARQDDSEAALRERLDGDRQPEIVIETVGGQADTMNLALKLAYPGGTVVMVGGYWETQRFDYTSLLMKELRVTSSNCYSSLDGASDFNDAMAIMRRKPEFAEVMVTHEFGLDDATAAFETAFDKSTGSIKVMLAP